MNEDLDRGGAMRIHNISSLRHMKIMVSGFILSSYNILDYFELKIIQPQNYTGFISKIISFLGVAAVAATHCVSHSRYQLLEILICGCIPLKKYIIIDICNHFYHCVEAMFHLLHFVAFWLVKIR